MKEKKSPTKSKIIKKAEKALKKAVVQVIEEHRQKNIPLIVWKNGRVVKIPANKI